ncbi:MAG: substrate-binding domain-containing protein [Gemmatimonadota bacterium]|nr:MAG: substrate-binding domain-containing protein [Gemmatimonadota bacterium]
MERQHTFATLLVSFLVGALACGACGEGKRRTLVLGVPTTVEDSGLLDALLPEFERAHPQYRLRYVSAGSGELLSLGARGDLDVLLSHSRRAEEEFMAAGHGVMRRRVMENDFVIVGPADDPARVGGMTHAAAALTRIGAVDALFLSRGDDSGTHRKELELRSTAGLAAGGAGYRELGQGMGEVLRAASDLGAYTLCDRATYLNLRETLDLEVLLEGDPRLLNVYHVIVVAGGREAEAAHALAIWLTSEAGRRAIAAYGTERFDRPLFRPWVEAEAVR